MNKVLIAVKDNDSLKTLFSLCKEKGCKVIATDNSGQIFQTITDEHINILFLDLNLPRLEIDVLLPAIFEIIGEMPVVIVADAPDVANEIKARMNRILYLAYKPLNPDEIKPVLQSAIDLTSLGKYETVTAPADTVVLETAGNEEFAETGWVNIIVNIGDFIVLIISTVDQLITNLVKSLASDLTAFFLAIKRADKFITNAVQRY